MGTMNFPLSLLLIAFHVVNGLFLPPFPDIPAKNCTFNLTQANILEINEASGLDLFEGDIVHDTKSRNTIIGSKYRWPLTVPYYLEDSLDINAKGVILKAFERFRLKTCIDFKPWSGEKNYISVFKGLGCYSLVGNQQAGKQLLSIGAGCDTVESVQHELLHALGFFHEQSRSDRDDYITVVWANIQSGKSSNFKLYDSSKATFLEVPYDYTSVMHYGKKAFSTGNVTMIPKNAKFDNIIGQQTDFSASDVLKLNRLYNCTSSGLFLDSCNFESDDVCGMLKSSGTGSNWQRVTQAPGGPSSDHTYMENRVGNFMHLSTRTGNAGYQSILESRLFYPVRKYQCLEFFYYNSGSKNDRLNIYIKQYLPDFPNGIYILVDTISGNPADFWRIRYTSIYATNKFRFAFKGIKGTGYSSGGFSIDDINLSETECPQNTWHIRNFPQQINNTFIYSPSFYSKDGYAFQIGLYGYASQNSPFNLAVYLFLISGANDETLQWPCLWKQVTVEFLDQNPDAKQRVTNVKSITTDGTIVGGRYFMWDNPALVGWNKRFSNGTQYKMTGGSGAMLFTSKEWLDRNHFLKGGDAIILLSVEGAKPLVTCGMGVQGVRTCSSAEPMY
ncbi:meprin A subunit beta-like isoform X2 [Rana temporaria]|uniref:meprin A subunit beta-like isoform X2 n=1 Tax=Rana temporaria TaxID=8407 RepID=UPI001AAC57A6|nr:meprin A subunit beta-like isoform X2 [Rana temporaria]